MEVLDIQSIRIYMCQDVFTSNGINFRNEFMHIGIHFDGPN